MAEITMDMVKDIREKTGAGIADCKKALTEAAGNIEAAIEYLRKAGIAKAAKKADREVKEGRIVTFLEAKHASMIEVLCETDFVASNEKFINFLNETAKNTAAIAGNGCVTDAVKAKENDALVSLIATIGENMQIRRAVKWDVTGVAGAYIHGGRIGILVEGEGANVDAEFLREIGMHIAAFSPTYIVPEDVPAEVIAKEREIAASLPDLAGKPEQIKGKIIDGKIKKWYSEVCLMKQPWFKEPSTCLEALKPGLKITRFIRWSTTDEV